MNDWHELQQQATQKTHNHTSRQQSSCYSLVLSVSSFLFAASFFFLPVDSIYPSSLVVCLPLHAPIVCIFMCIKTPQTHTQTQSFYVWFVFSFLRYLCHCFLVLLRARALVFVLICWEYFRSHVHIYYLSSFFFQYSVPMNKYRSSISLFRSFIQI